MAEWLVVCVAVFAFGVHLGRAWGMKEAADILRGENDPQNN